jgi:hypothetical protein
MPDTTSYLGHTRHSWPAILGTRFDSGTEELSQKGPAPTQEKLGKVDAGCGCATSSRRALYAAKLCAK